MNVDVSQALYAVEAAIAGRAVGRAAPPPLPRDRAAWPPDYGRVLLWREQQLAKFERDPALLAAARAWYAGDDLRGNPRATSDDYAARCAAFICHWCDTFDPRNAGKPGKTTRMPMVLFRRQEDLVYFVLACLLGDAPGLVDKSRDMGATWVCLSVSMWLWLFWDGVAVGWGANKLELVDKIGEPDTIFEKLRTQIELLPDCFRPPVERGVHLKHTVCSNPLNGAVVRGQGGRTIGRGGRSRIYFVDESAHLEYADAVEASLSENTRCRIDISSAGSPGTVFDRTRLAGEPWERGGPVRRDAANVFVLDWRDHPEKNPEWYSIQRKKYEDKGQPHVVAREIDRNPMGAAVGVIIKYEWVEAAVDAHKIVPGLDDSGGYWGGLDLADGGIDCNALVRGRGAVVKHAEEITDRDPGAVARRAFRTCRSTAPMALQYDSGGGFGGSVKSEFNRLAQDDGVDVSWLKLVPWSAGAPVLDPGLPVIPGDKSSPTNKNFFENFKAQAWWNVAQMFYRTWRAVRAARGELDDGEGADYPPDQLISLDSATIPQAVLVKLMRELSQATMGQSTRLKCLVEKAPDGAKSPNLADGLIMGRFPSRVVGAPLVAMYGPKIFVG